MENNKRVTAVEWLMEHITYDNRYGQRWVSFKEATDLNIYFQKAKAMEKEQIMEFVYSAVRQILDEDRQNPFNLEQYYNETYGN